MSHVSDLQLEDLPGVQPHVISKLKQAGIHSILDLAVSISNELAVGGANNKSLFSYSSLNTCSLFEISVVRELISVVSCCTAVFTGVLDIFTLGKLIGTLSSNN